MLRLDDFALISRVLLFADQRAFSTLVSHHESNIRRFFLMQTGGDEMLSDDLAQETFIRIWENLSSFRQASSFSTWLYQIAHNIWIDYLRQQKKDCFLQPIDEETLLLPNDEASLIQEAREQRVLKALSMMPEPARTCITLYYLENMKVKEIAKITGLSDDNVRMVLSRGRKKLKELYGQD